VFNSVSVPNGASSHEWVNRDWDWLQKFDKIVLCYDNDEAGRNAIVDIRGRLDFANLYELEYNNSKDINDMYMNDCENLFKTVRTPKEINMDGFISLQSVSTKIGVTDTLSSTGLSGFDQIFGGIGLNQSTIICSESGAGKACPLTSKISTPNGWIYMGDVKVGDTITGFNKTTKVVGVYPQGMRPVYELVLNDGRRCLADAEHIWTHTAKEFKRYVLRNSTTLELKERLDNNKTVILPNVDMVHYNPREVLLDPYAVGALIGDGCLTCNSLTISSSEKDVVAKVAKGLSREFAKCKSNNYSWILYGGMSDIKKLGLCCTARDKFIPDEYKYNTEEVRMSILQGL
ncbi:MAG: toprim domain-containing protein, partial [Cetobacterium sp.]